MAEPYYPLFGWADDSDAIKETEAILFALEIEEGGFSDTRPFQCDLVGLREEVMLTGEKGFQNSIPCAEAITNYRVRGTERRTFAVRELSCSLETEMKRFRGKIKFTGTSVVFRESGLSITTMALIRDLVEQAASWCYLWPDDVAFEPANLPHPIIIRVAKDDSLDGPEVCRRYWRGGALSVEETSLTGQVKLWLRRVASLPDEEVAAVHLSYAARLLLVPYVLRWKQWARGAEDFFLNFPDGIPPGLAVPTPVFLARERCWFAVGPTTERVIHCAGLCVASLLPGYHPFALTRVRGSTVPNLPRKLEPEASQDAFSWINSVRKKNAKRALAMSGGSSAKARRHRLTDVPVMFQRIFDKGGERERTREASQDSPFCHRPLTLVMDGAQAWEPSSERQCDVPFRKLNEGVVHSLLPDLNMCLSQTWPAVVTEEVEAFVLPELSLAGRPDGVPLVRRYRRIAPAATVTSEPMTFAQPISELPGSTSEVLDDGAVRALLNL